MLLIPQGGATPDVWTVQLVDVQDMNNPMVLAEATLTVAYRFTFLRYDPSLEQLADAGLDTMHTDTIAAIFSSPAAGQVTLYGFTQHLDGPPLVAGGQPILIDSFGALGITPDINTALAEAADLSTAILPPSAPPDDLPFPKVRDRQINWRLVNPNESNQITSGGLSGQTTVTTNQASASGGSKRDCVQENKNCVDAAKLRQSARDKECFGESAVGAVGCGIAAAPCGPAVVACYGVCAAGVITHEVTCLWASSNKFDADLLDCSNGYSQCCANNDCPPEE